MNLMFTIYMMECVTVFHTHTCTMTCTQTHNQRNTHKLQLHTQMQINTSIKTHTQTYTVTNKQTRTHITKTHTDKHTHANTHRHTQIHTGVHKHTETHIQAYNSTCNVDLHIHFCTILIQLHINNFTDSLSILAFVCFCIEHFKLVLFPKLQVLPDSNNSSLLSSSSLFTYYEVKLEK